MTLEGRSALWEIFWMAAIKSGQGASVFTWFPAMFSQHVVDLWLSLEAFGIQKSINKWHWSVMWGWHSDWWDTNSFSPVCEGKTTPKVPRQMTRDPVRIQCKMFLLVKLPQWKFLSWKAALLHGDRLILWYTEILCWVDSGFIGCINILWCLCTPQRREAYRLYGSINVG